MNLKKFYSYTFSVSLVSAIVFGYGKHPTVDAILLTVAWVVIIAGLVAIAALSFITVAIRHADDGKMRNDRDMGSFYKALQDMHSNIWHKLISFAIAGYWLYAFILHEWTATAVVYVISVIWTQIYIALTKDLAKDFFLAQLKGEGATE